MSPLTSKLVNQCRLPSTVFPIPKKTSVSSSKSDVNSVLSIHSIARSPILLTCNSTLQEPKASKDQAFYLTEMVHLFLKHDLRTLSSFALKLIYFWC